MNDNDIEDEGEEPIAVDENSGDGVETYDAQSIKVLTCDRN